MQTLSIESLRRIEAICSRFEEDSVDGPQPIGPLLGRVSVSEREHLLRELVAIDVELRINRNESPQISDYRDLGTQCDPAMPPGAIADVIHEVTDAADPRPQSERYDFIEKIGCGGNGDVWRIYDRESQRTLAIKFLRDRLRCDEAAEKRLMREALLTGTLQHPGIPPIYDHGKLDDGTSFFSMKLVGGDTLASILKESSGDKKHDSSTRHLGIFEQLAQTVAYAHAQGVIHRDLKPDNVMVGDFGEVQVMDWGMAKRISANLEDTNDDLAWPTSRKQPQSAIETLPASEDDSCDNLNHSLTAAGDVMGTPAYMAPEQARGEVKTLDARCDVFTLGVILFEILTGRRLHEGKSVGESLTRTATGQFEDAIDLLRDCDVHEDLRMLCERCLQLSVTHRPGDAGEIADTMTDYLAGAERRARQTEMEQREASVREREDRRRRRLQTQTAAAIALVSVIGSALAISQWRQATRANAKADSALTLADQRFDQAKSVVDEFFTEVADQQGLLATAPGAQPVRRKLLEKARDYYETFLAESGNDPEMQLTVAKAYARLGEIEMVLDPGGEDLIEYQQKVIEICNSFLDQSPEHPDFLEARAQANRAIGNKHSFADHFSLALPKYEEALPDLEKLAVARGNTNDRFELAKVYQNIGRAAYYLKDFERSEEMLTKAIEIGSEIQQSSSDNAEYAIQLAQMHNGLGILHGWGLKDWKRCDVSLSTAMQLAKVACELSPDLLAYRNELARNQMNFAMTCTHMKKFEQAEKEFRDCIANYEKLAEENPTTALYREGVALASGNFSTFSLRRKRIDVSVEFSKKSYESYRRLVELQPTLKHFFDLELNARKDNLSLTWEADQAAGIEVEESLSKAQIGLQDLVDRYGDSTQLYPDAKAYTIDRAYWAALLREPPAQKLLDWTESVPAEPNQIRRTPVSHVLARALAFLRNERRQETLKLLEARNGTPTAPNRLIECLAIYPTDPKAAESCLREAEKLMQQSRNGQFDAFLLHAEAKRLCETE